MDQESSSENEFKKMFKYYKRKKPLPDLQNVIDPSVHHFKHHFDEIEVYSDKGNKEETELYCQPRGKWKIFSSKLNPGFFLILNVFSPEDQYYWIRQCLTKYTSNRYRRNIDAHSNIEDWYSHVLADNNKGDIDKLRWSTLGYHHNWDTKVYDESDKGEFPSDLAKLSSHIVQALGYQRYKAEAAIVNYYPENTTLSGHTDHSEHNLSAPLVSISFGQSGIFLLGGKSLDVSPSAYLLKSGYVAVMTKEARLCYHAVPKILVDPSLVPDMIPEKAEQYDGSKLDQSFTETSTTVDHENFSAKKMKLETENRKDASDNSSARKEDNSETYRFISDYLKNHRINLNIRQVNQI
eukprot:TRINITY_DN8497_c0_g1_i4.p1 TRINITY_DN8497_c0_g1~~TRINITY_DN8497_c0_g1_i4.p1  ORF type:complete len:362 (-),score=59.68 TRINITY_DN8497_c0_g1_i4:37-1089(-)